MANQVNDAQSFLLKLLQILTPLAKGEISESQKKDAVTFANRFFVPPSDKEREGFRPPAHLLTALQSRERQMAHWAEATLSEKPREEVRFSERALSAPMSRQAQKLIWQVRVAIQTLSTSANLEEPKPALFRETIKRLKPLIDELIEAVSRDGMHSGDDEPPPSFFRREPKPAQERLFEKTSQRAARSFRTLPSSSTKAEISLVARASSLPHSSRTAAFPSPMIPFVLEEKKPFHREVQKGEGRAFSVEKPQVVPFLSEARIFPLYRKPKKKRKRFQLSEEEEEERPPHFSN